VVAYESYKGADSLKTLMNIDLLGGFSGPLSVLCTESKLVRHQQKDNCYKKYCVLENTGYFVDRKRTMSLLIKKLLSFVLSVNVVLQFYVILNKLPIWKMFPNRCYGLRRRRRVGGLSGGSLVE